MKANIGNFVHINGNRNLLYFFICVQFITKNAQININKSLLTTVQLVVLLKLARNTATRS